MIITFSGIDGSGKTTQAQYVVEYLTCAGLRVRYIHMIQWTMVNRLGRFLHPRINQGDYKEEIKSRKRRFVYLQQLVSILDILRFRIFVLPFNNMRKSIIVCDRFFYDLGIQALYAGVMKSKTVSRYWELIPNPTISILLDVTPRVALQRENEHSLSYYQTKRRLYLDAVALWGATVIDASDLEPTQQKIIELVRPHLERELHE